MGTTHWMDAISDPLVLFCKKNAGCTFIFNWGGCCVCDRKIDTSRQNNSFEKVDYFNMGQVVWSSLNLISSFLYSIEFR